VRLIAKPFVKSNKNDAADAEAIREAAQRPNMRFVSVKSVEQQDIQAMHRMRSLVVERRTAQVTSVETHLRLSPCSANQRVLKSSANAWSMSRSSLPAISAALR
jgi:transposase